MHMLPADSRIGPLMRPQTARAAVDRSARGVNGWTNAGLPWSCKLDRARMDFPR